MARQHHALLARLDPIGLNRYQITENDIQIVERYLSIIQADLQGSSAWDDLIRYLGVYGTSILIHEVVELRELRLGEQELQGQTQRSLRRFLAEHVEAHIIALYEEHLYLQEAIRRRFGETFEVATLVKANRNDERDLQLFLESDIGIFLLEEDRVGAARRVFATLKGETT